MAIKKISVFGTGYVGLITGLVFAEAGFSVHCIDVDEQKIESLTEGKAPFFEPGLEQLLLTQQKFSTITFSGDPITGLSDSDYIIIAVGTPALANGEANLEFVDAAAQTIALHAAEAIVLVKSTVPMGTCARLAAYFAQYSPGLSVVSNPEFLRQGSAIQDCIRPDRIILGCQDKKTESSLRELYSAWVQREVPLIVMDWASSELTKYAANAFLATKISFINEISRLSEVVGADIEEVAQGIGLDPRVGREFLRAGCGYGGSCFPKDVKALIQVAEQQAVEVPLLKATEITNQLQKHALFEKLQKHFSSLAGKVIAVWGLAFKPHTDDLREASSRVLIDALLQAGAQVHAYDPVAMPNARALWPQHPSLRFCEAPEAAAHQADAIVIVTEWPHFKTVKWETIRDKLHHPLVIDGRNLLELQRMLSLGFIYESMGRRIIK